MKKVYRLLFCFVIVSAVLFLPSHVYAEDGDEWTLTIFPKGSSWYCPMAVYIEPEVTPDSMDDFANSICIDGAYDLESVISQHGVTILWQSCSSDGVTIKGISDSNISIGIYNSARYVNNEFINDSIGRSNMACWYELDDSTIKDTISYNRGNFNNTFEDYGGVSFDIHGCDSKAVWVTVQDPSREKEFYSEQYRLEHPEIYGGQNEDVGVVDIMESDEHIEQTIEPTPEVILNNTLSIVFPAVCSDFVMDVNISYDGTVNQLEYLGIEGDCTVTQYEKGNVNTEKRFILSGIRKGQEVRFNNIGEATVKLSVYQSADTDNIKEYSNSWLHPFDGGKVNIAYEFPDGSIRQQNAIAYNISSDMDCTISCIVVGSDENIEYVFHPENRPTPSPEPTAIPTSEPEQVVYNNSLTIKSQLFGKTMDLVIRLDVNDGYDFDKNLSIDGNILPAYISSSSLSNSSKYIVYQDFDDSSEVLLSGIGNANVTLFPCFLADFNAFSIMHEEWIHRFNSDTHEYYIGYVADGSGVYIGSYPKEVITVNVDTSDDGVLTIIVGEDEDDVSDKIHKLTNGIQEDEFEYIAESEYSDSVDENTSDSNSKMSGGFLINVILVLIVFSCVGYVIVSGKK